MDVEFFEQIRAKALNNIISNCPAEKRDSIASKLYEQQLEMASRVCVEMLKEYHKVFASNSSSEKVSK